MDNLKKSRVVDSAPIAASAARWAFAILAAMQLTRPVAVLAQRTVMPRSELSRDSAGVEVVDNRRGIILATTRLVVDERSEEATADTGVSASSFARMLTDRRLAVTDNASSQLFLEDTRAHTRQIIGRRGSGPSDFQALRGLWRCAGDTLVVKSGAMDIKIVSPSGRIVRTVSDPQLRGAALGVSADCEAVAIAIPITLSQAAPADSALIAWFDLKKRSVVEVVRVALQPRQEVEYLGELQAVPVPFAPRPSFAVYDQHVYVGSGAAPEVRAFDRRGKLSRIIRWAAASATVTRNDKTRYAETRLQLDKAVARGVTAQMPAIHLFDLPVAKPAYSHIAFDLEGNLWVRKYPADWEGFERLYGPQFSVAVSDWWIFDPQGFQSGTATLPANFTVKDVVRGAVLGLRLSGQGAPYVAILPLVRDPRP